jgi:hypothetical protein
MQGKEAGSSFSLKGHEILPKKHIPNLDQLKDCFCLRIPQVQVRRFGPEDLYGIGIARPTGGSNQPQTPKLAPFPSFPLRQCMTRDDKASTVLFQLWFCELL